MDTRDAQIVHNYVHIKSLLDLARMNVPHWFPNEREEFIIKLDEAELIIDNMIAQFNPLFGSKDDE